MNTTTNNESTVVIALPASMLAHVARKAADGDCSIEDVLRGLVYVDMLGEDRPLTPEQIAHIKAEA